MNWAKQHLTKKHRASSEDDQGNKEEKKARMEEELQSKFYENIIDKLGDKEDQDIPASQAANIKDILSKYESENVVTVENITYRCEVRKVDKDEANKFSKVKLKLRLEGIKEVE